MNISKYNTVRPISDEFFNQLISRLESAYSLSNGFKSKLRSVLYEVSLKKGTNLLNEGAKQTCIYFSLTGIFREISTNKVTCTAKTSWFWLEFAFIYAMPGFFDQEPSEVTINVVKDSLVAFISYENWKHLRQDFEETDKLTEILRRNNETERKQHLNDCKILNTEERYIKYENRVDQLLKHLQLRHVAEYLGMAVDTLGKLRRKFVKQRY